MAVELQGHPGTPLQEELTQALVSEAQNRQVRGIKSLSLDGDTMQDLFRIFRIPLERPIVLESFANPDYRFQVTSSFLAEVDSIHSMREKIRILSLTLTYSDPSDDNWKRDWEVEKSLGAGKGMV